MRLAARRDLLQQFDHAGQHRNLTANTQHDRQNEEAFGVLLSEATHTAFSLDREFVKTRDRYGRGKWGQSVLLARRLIEAGVRMAFVNWPREQGDLSADNLWGEFHQLLPNPTTARS